MKGPAPKISVTAVPNALTAAASFFLVSRSWSVEVAHVVEELGGELAAGQGDDTGRCDLRQEMSRLTCADLLGDHAGHQLAEHRAQPAGDLVPGPAQITVTLSPHLQHRP